MAILTTGNTFSDGDQVTSTKLNNIANGAAFASGSVDDSTTQISGGAIIVKDLGISAGKIAASAVTTSKIASDVVISTSGSITGAAGSFTTLSASGVVSVPDGSESAPSITNTGDTNTGIYFPAENSVALTAGAGATLTSTNTAITIGVPTSIVSTAQSDFTLQGGDANSKNLIFKKASAQQGKITAVGDELKFYAGTSVTESLEITTTGVVVPGDTVLNSDLAINVAGDSNTSKAIVINTSGTNFESDAGIIQATHAASGSLTGGYWLKFNANSADKFTVRGDGRTEISSTTGGVILPRMTTTQMNAISSPANGEMIYNTTASKFYGYADGAWVAIH